METPWARSGNAMMLQIRTVVVLILGFCLSAGCGRKAQPLPSTYPVRGKVVFRQGGAMAGGTICFQSQAEPDVSAAGEIGPDGSFEITSFVAGNRAAGAAAGKHRVLVVPAVVDQSQSAPSIPPQMVEVSPGENDVTITIDDPSKTP
jgi:hypothetical protein